MTATVIRADARNLPLPDESVDLIVTSPPYFALRSYQDGGEHYEGQIGAEATPTEFVEALLTCTREWMRVLRPTGSIFVNLGDRYAAKAGAGPNRARPNQTVAPAGDWGIPPKSLLKVPERYAIGCIDQLGLVNRADIVWSKPNGLPESVTDRVRRSHEVFFHFTKEARYFSSIDEIREPYKPETARRYNSGFNFDATRPAAQLTKGTNYRDGDRYNQNPLGKLPGSVWQIATEPLSVPDHLGVDHFAAFPTEWPRLLTLAFCPEGGTVLDPFGGTGTTAMVAHALGRHGISVDLSFDYCRIAEWRTTDPAQLAKVRGQRKPVEQVEGQHPLFEVSA